jgi:ABC-type multidrug transport system ATPase subunit
MLSVSPRVLYGLFNYLQLYFAAFLFCGMFVDPEDVVWPLRLFCYFLPLRWALQSYMFSVYHGAPDYDGAQDCTPGELMDNPHGSPIICGQQAFFCSSPSDPTGAVCYGRTGDQILNSLSLQFTIFGDEGHYARNLGLIVAFGVLCRLLYAAQVVLLTKVAGSEEPRPPTGAPSPNGAPSLNGARPPAVAPSALAPDAAAAEAQEGAPAAAMGRAGAGADACAFAFSNIGYEITPKNALGAAKGPPKSVLAGTSATITEGEVLAIVGPSGAGKTVLLDTLNFAKGPGSPTGAISLNGRPLTRALHTRACIYVPREDILWPSLTPRQHMRFAFRLYQPALDAAAREAAIDDLLAATGMTSAQHTKAGGLLFQGLSGGQRRRLSLCIALAKQPRVLLLDEPTSGLDSAAAAAIVALLKSIAAKCSAAIVCTIHQPSAAVFAGFHQVLVLSEGRVAYCGTRDEMAPHFASIGKPLRTRDGDGALGAVAVEANPAEAVLDLVSKDISSKQAVADVLDAWAASPKAAPKPPPAELAATVLEPRAIGACGQTLVVLRRQFYLAFNDPLQYLARFVVCPFVCAFFGLVYVASREHSQKQVPFRLFYLWWILCIPPCLCIISIIGMTTEMRSVIFEIRNGMYRSLSYVLSTTVVQAPMMVALSFAINVVVFAVGGWPWDNFVTFVLQYAVNLFVFESLAQLLIVALPNPILGMLAFLMYWTTSIVFCGLVFRGGDVIWPFRLLYYVMPLQWLFNGLGYDLYTPSTYDGAAECVPGEEVTTDQGAATCAATGFYCTDASQSLGCYGRTGSQVLETLHFAYESLDSADDRVMDVLIMLGMALVLKLAFVLVLWRTVEQSDSPKQPARAIS